MSHSKQKEVDVEACYHQLIRLREEKVLFLNTHFPEYDGRRTNAEKMLNAYTDALVELLNSGEEPQNVVLIGSTVTVTYTEEDMTDTFVIVFPEEADPGQNRISFLSPIAEKLLLRTWGDVIPVETPMNVFHVRIDRITAPVNV
ncbi:GreA/GreB family elongation factor [Paenibacillus sp. CAU 1782]